MKVRCVLFVPLLVAGTLACEPNTGPGIRPSPAVYQLIATESLPKVASIEVIVDVPTEGVQLFKVFFGDSIADSRCWESCRRYPSMEAIGFTLGGDAGWLTAPSTSVVGLFDVKPTHTYLVSADLFDRVSRASEILFQQTFKSRLASDPDTPLEGLRRIVHHLPSWISPSLAEILLDNPQVVADRELLEFIADLPVYQGDAYAPARARAQALLSDAP